MRIRRIVLLLWMLPLLACAGETWKPGFYPLVSENQKSRARTAKLLAEIRAADCEIDFEDTKVDLGIGRLKNGVGRTPQLFGLDELEWYFANRRRTGFIVVHLSFVAGKDARSEVTAASLKSYFTRLGYSHLLFLSPHSLGIVIYEDFQSTKS